MGFSQHFPCCHFWWPFKRGQISIKWKDTWLVPPLPPKKILESSPAWHVARTKVSCASNWMYRRISKLVMLYWWSALTFRAMHVEWWQHQPCLSLFSSCVSSKKTWKGEDVFFQNGASHILVSFGSQIGSLEVAVSWVLCAWRSNFIGHIGAECLETNPQSPSRFWKKNAHNRSFSSTAGWTWHSKSNGQIQSLQT